MKLMMPFGICGGVQFMTAEIVNLNKVRKARERANRERDAQENRLKYGQSKADRSLLEATRRKSQAELDGARRQPGGLMDDDDSGPDNAS
jgi:hypothetical protein